MPVPRSTAPLLWVVDQFYGDEAVARQPEHCQGAERRPCHGPDDRVADGGIEREGLVEIADPQADVQGAHSAQLSQPAILTFRC